jgi:hypothetical protein
MLMVQRERIEELEFSLVSTYMSELLMRRGPVPMRGTIGSLRAEHDVQCDPYRAGNLPKGPHVVWINEKSKFPLESYMYLYIV